MRYSDVILAVEKDVSAINLFTTMLATPLLGKRPIKAPNLKLLRPFFPPFACARKVISIKMHNVDLLRDHQIYCLQACMCVLFSPEILQAGSVKWLRV